jgi:hypothetical protein
MDDGGWTVIQSRVDDTTDFYRDWDDYVAGFGQAGGNYWMGLEAIHKLTEGGAQLRVELELFDEGIVVDRINRKYSDPDNTQRYIERMSTTGGSAYALYSEFSVGDSASNYTLSVSGYSGTAGNSLTYHDGMMFSTKDMDNDRHSSVHCATHTNYQGGWWFNICGYSNLNGRYYPESYTGSNYGIHWYHYMHRIPSPYRHVYMKVRRTNM